MSYFDPIRKKNVPSTPEESVRQSVLHFLKNNLKVTEHLIEVEVSLTNIQKTNRDRVDILVHQFRNSKNIDEPWLLVECKAKDQYTWNSLEIQVNRYLKVLKPSYILLQLGDEHIYLERIPSKIPNYPSFSD